MTELVRPLVYRGSLIDPYNINLHTGEIRNSKTKRKIKLQQGPTSSIMRYTGTISIRRGGDWYSRAYCPETKRNLYIMHSVAMASTFFDKVKKSPLVDFLALDFAVEECKVTFDTGFSLAINCIQVDHIDDDHTNKDFSNLQVITALENTLKKCGRSGRKYKGICYIKSKNRWEAKVDITSIIHSSGKSSRITRLYRTEIEAALGYNELLKQVLTNAFGNSLGLRVYKVAYKNIIDPDELERAKSGQLYLDL